MFVSTHKFALINQTTIMKKSNFILLLLLGFTSILFAQNTFTLSSKDLGGQTTKSQEFNGFGCTGDNESPQLSWENAPEGTKSFAITMYDPDAPTGSGWWHWLVFDIPSKHPIKKETLKKILEKKKINKIMGNLLKIQVKILL